MTLIVNLCTFCVHFDAYNRASETCTAYREGIPEAILLMRADHRQPYRGDGGIRFAARPGTEDLLPPVRD